MLNFKNYPDAGKRDLIDYCEKNFLTTALLFLKSQVYVLKNNTSCLEVLFSLITLYKKASAVRSKLDVHMLPSLSRDNPMRYEIESS